MDIERFKKLPIMGILRGIEPEILEPLVEAIIPSGLETIEITMNTKGAPDLIRKLVKFADKKLTIGAGTVLNVESLKEAVDSGASFIVSPVAPKEVLEYCVKNNIPVFPGALTPQEIYNAWEQGATMVKVFPSKFFGASYFKEIKAPLNDVKLLACGGVNPENIRSYFDNGADAVAFGGSIFKKDLLAKKDFVAIANGIKEFVAAYK